MVYRSNTLYAVLAVVNFIIALCLILASFSLEVSWLYATLIISVFFLMLAVSYFQLSSVG